MSRSHMSAISLVATILVAAFAVFALAGCTAAGSSSSSASSSESAASSESSSVASESSAAEADSTEGSGSANVASAGETATSAASSATSSKPSANTQTIGNSSVGYIEVPKSWVDRTSDVDPRMVDSYRTVYYADPDSEFTSAVLGHFAFSRSIEMTNRPTSYTDVAKGIVDKAKADTSTYGDVTTEEIKINGHSAILIATSMPDDNLAMCSIVIDRDGDGRSAVTLAMNCGPLDGDSYQEVLQSASTWTL